MLILALTAWGVVQTARLGAATERLTAAQRVVTGLTAATVAKDKLIETMDAANRRLFALTEAQNVALARAEGEMRQLRQTLIAQRQKQAEHEKQDRENPNCQILLHTPLGACPNIARGVRERAAGDLSGP